MTALDSLVLLVYYCSYAPTPCTARGVARQGNTQCCLSFLCAAQQAAAAQAINIKQRADSNLISIKCRATAAAKREEGAREDGQAIRHCQMVVKQRIQDIRMYGYADMQQRNHVANTLPPVGRANAIFIVVATLRGASRNKLRK